MSLSILTVAGALFLLSSSVTLLPLLVKVTGYFYSLTPLYCSGFVTVIVTAIKNVKKPLLMSAKNN
jgi:hypothetical protein